MYWYYFLEVFDHFRAFFLCVFHLHILAYLPPLTIGLRCVVLVIRLTIASHPSQPYLICPGIIRRFFSRCW